MGFEIATTASGSFELYLASALASSGQVFLFDQDTLIDEVGGYHTLYYDLHNHCGRAFYELDAAEVNEQNLVSCFLKGTDAMASPGSQTSSHSNFRLLTDFIDSRHTGLICIHDGQNLSTRGIHILARLRNQIRRKNLGWQIFIFARAAAMNNLALLQLSIDSSYPASAGQAWRRHQHQAKLSPSAALLPVYTFRIVLVMAACWAAAYLVWKLGPV